MPSDKIKAICQDELGGTALHSIVDFGSGTLYWSEWLAQKYRCTVYAVDTQYTERHPEIKGSGIILKDDVLAALEALESVSMVWMCDVVHHLDPSFAEKALALIMEKADFIILKDINGNRRFGNFMNRMHDRVINGEKINDVFPERLAKTMEARGFAVHLYELPKLWYPHFMLVAKRKGME